jgi:hypothetical protein
MILSALIVCVPTMILILATTKKCLLHIIVIPQVLKHMIPEIATTITRQDLNLKRMVIHVIVLVEEVVEDQGKIETINVMDMIKEMSMNPIIPQENS